MIKSLETTHPKNGYDVVLTFDSVDFKLLTAEYTDGESVELTERIKNDFQADIERFAKDDDTLSSVTTSHPENHRDIYLAFDEDYRLENATYSDDKQDVNLSNELKSYFQKKIDEAIKN